MDLPRFTVGPSASTTGFSDVARYSEGVAREVGQRLRDSFSLGNGIRSAMEDLCAEAERCSAPGWDGFGALQVETEAYRWAYAFLEALPPGLPVPAVSAEPDGQISFEWYRNVYRLISVSVSCDGDLHYAALLGPNKVYGTEAFLDQVPARVIALIKEVTMA